MVIAARFALHRHRLRHKGRGFLAQPLERRVKFGQADPVKNGLPISR
jgi:hypothetical protein